MIRISTLTNITHEYVHNINNDLLAILVVHFEMRNVQ